MTFSTKVLKERLNLALVSSYLRTQHGHLLAVHDLVFILKISSEEELLISIGTFCQICEDLYFTLSKPYQLVSFLWNDTKRLFW